MKTLGKILGYIALALAILLIFIYLVDYIDRSLPQHFLPDQVQEIIKRFVRPYAGIVIIGIIVLTTMMKHSIVLTIIFAILVGAVLIFMIVADTTSTSAIPENPEEFVNAIKALVC